MNAQRPARNYFPVLTAICLVVAMADSTGRIAAAATRVALEPQGIGREGDEAGGAVASYGDTAAVGIPLAQPSPFIKSGAIAVLRNGATGWVREALLGPDDPVDSMRFGSSLGIGQDLLVTAGDLHNGNSAIYTFARTGSQWSLSDRFTIAGSDPSIALSGNTLIVSARYGTPAAVVYARDGDAWVEQATLAGANPDEEILETAIDGDVAASFGTFGSSSFVHFYSRSA
ncbi:MAG: hypothetical protein ACREPX_09050, partial [Rhodanobacteraceae bacterium]